MTMLMQKTDPNELVMCPGCSTLCTVSECHPVPDYILVCPACGRPMLRAVVRDGQYRLMYEVRKDAND